MRKGTRSCYECKITVSELGLASLPTPEARSFHDNTGLSVGPPLISMMRLGRRRKTKCAYAEGSPSRCKECHARGTPCLDQDKGPARTSPTTSAPNLTDGNVDDVKYSLRERVARLEDFVKECLGKEDAPTPPALRKDHVQPTTSVVGFGNFVLYAYVVDGD
jgi:hypothetical protein